ncbi:hypothetical protein OUZ56_002082 [Daphnia magna]|uniref:Uncharacterized protein n=1 Tax=Daphnia magna TaxID=35525 RepID=A0ABR0A4M3_9CRUS|nr:hypothetical protein OUZ56_002082 [Daphnia magna]
MFSNGTYLLDKKGNKIHWRGEELFEMFLILNRTVNGVMNNKERKWMERRTRKRGVYIAYKIHKYSDLYIIPPKLDGAPKQEGLYSTYRPY